MNKGRRVGGRSKFALLEVSTAKAAAAKYTAAAIVLAPTDCDPSHSLIKGYEAHSDKVAEELAKVVIATYLAKF